jgi:hypothetical protein
MTYTQTQKTKERTLVVIDIEDLAGASFGPSISDLQTIRTALETAVPRSQTTLWVVACSSSIASQVAFQFAGVRQIWTTDPRGASFALDDVLAAEAVDTRISNVVICSGNSILAGEAARLGGCGIDVTATVGMTPLSTELRLAVRNSSDLPIFEVLLAAASGA